MDKLGALGLPTRKPGVSLPLGTQLSDGRSVRLFNVIDDFNREALCIEVGQPGSNGR